MEIPTTEIIVLMFFFFLFFWGFLLAVLIGVPLGIIKAIKKSKMEGIKNDGNNSA